MIQISVTEPGKTIMRIKINDKRKISAIQKEFSASFPYLRIEFFLRPDKRKVAYNKLNLIIPENKTIGDFRKVHNETSVTITPGMKVSKLEQVFKDDFGLYVQVFRKSGRVWLETTMTDDWTLAEQNREGEELSKYRAPREKPPAAEDYQELE